LKKLHWFILLVFAAAGTYLRIQHLRTGFEENGLPIAGNPYAYALPAVLGLGTLVFILLARAYPAQRDETGDIVCCFPYGNVLSVLLAILGSFAFLAYGALTVMLRSSVPMLIVGAAYLLSGIAFVCSVFQLRRGSGSVGSFLLAPVCTMVIRLVLTYRSCANDPTLGHTYIEILSVCALMLVFLELLAFVYRNGAPRLFLPLCAAAVMLNACHLVECTALPARVLTLGAILLTLSFCAAADFSAQN